MGNPTEYENKNFLCAESSSATDAGALSLIASEGSSRISAIASLTRSTYEKCMGQSQWVKIGIDVSNAPLVALKIESAKDGSIVDIKANSNTLSLVTQDGKLFTAMTNRDAVISMTARPSAGASFTGWGSTISCNGGNTSNPCILKLDGEKTGTASFYTPNTSVEVTPVVRPTVTPTPTATPVVATPTPTVSNKVSVVETNTGALITGDCLMERTSSGTGVNFAQCRFADSIPNHPNGSYSLPKSIVWANVILKFRFYYFGISNDVAVAYNQPNCVSNPSTYSYSLGSGINLATNVSRIPYKDVTTEITIPSVANTCTNLTEADPLYQYGIRSYKLNTTVWNSSSFAYAYFKPGETFNHASGDELSCNRGLDVDAYASGIRCTIGGGCTVGGKSPSTSSPSANPTSWGACYQLKTDCYSRSPVDWSQCYQVAPQ